ncbi:MAG: transposase [Bryobacteraceae bacterium]
MSRIARIVLENIPYHLTQRGNGRQQVFFENQDYRLYLDLLRNYSEDAHLRLWAYCLMPNHVHLIAVPERPEAMASALGRTHADFARHFNLRGRTCGHVWQARFFSCPLESAHLWRAAAYVERNPSRARIVKHPGEYPLVINMVQRTRPFRADRQYRVSGPVGLAGRVYSASLEHSACDGS